MFQKVGNACSNVHTSDTIFFRCVHHHALRICGLHIREKWYSRGQIYCPSGPSTEALGISIPELLPWYFHIIPTFWFSQLFVKESFFIKYLIILCCVASSQLTGYLLWLLIYCQCLPWLSGAVHVVVYVVLLSCSPSTPLSTNLLKLFSPYTTPHKN